MTGQSLRQRAAQTDVAQAEQQQADPTRDLRGLVEQMRSQIARALPKHLDPDRFARILLTVVSKTPQLAQCSRDSFLGALMTATQLGLEPGVGGECYLIPRKNHGKWEVSFELGYQGVAKLFWQSPLAQQLDAQAVYSNDHFDYAYGLEPRLEHRPALGDRGDLVCYYAVVGLNTGGRQFAVLTPAEVQELRGGKVGSSGNIADPQRWMERKTVLKQALKLMPKSSSLAIGLAADEAVRRESVSSLDQAAITGPAAATYERVEDEQLPAADTVTGEVLEPGDPHAPGDPWAQPQDQT